MCTDTEEVWGATCVTTLWMLRMPELLADSLAGFWEAEGLLGSLQKERQAADMEVRGPASCHQPCEPRGGPFPSRNSAETQLQPTPAGQPWEPPTQRPGHTCLQKLGGHSCGSFCATVFVPKLLSHCNNSYNSCWVLFCGRCIFWGPEFSGLCSVSWTYSFLQDEPFFSGRLPSCCIF